MITPRLIRARSGDRHLDRGAEGVWRVLTYVEGVCFSRPVGLDQVRAAGELLGRFHSAIADLDHTFQSVRIGVHDTARHLANLTRALDDHRDHRLFTSVHQLAQELQDRAEELPRHVGLPRRIVHGDPKLGNILFAGSRPPDCNRAVCMVDLDTCGAMEIHLELGDAFRSWCNPAGEGEPGRFSLELFRAAWSGYEPAAPPLTEAERAACATGVDWITLELTARFLADALQESYFGFDADRFLRAGEHNLARARSQWALHLDAAGWAAARRSIVTGG